MNPCRLPLLLVLASCSALSARRESAFFDVRAEDDRLAVAVESALRGLPARAAPARPVPIEARWSDTACSDGLTSSAGVRLSVDPHAGPDRLRFLVAHELAHYDLPPRARRLLPGVVQEGLADLAALRAVPALRDERLETYRLATLAVEPARLAEVVRLDGPSAAKLCADEYLAYTAAGVELAERVERAGPATLERLMARAEAEGLALVPLAWFD